MNTPPTKKRFKGFSMPEIPNGTWVGALTSEKYLATLGQIATEFEHLEHAMPIVLSGLIGISDSRVAGYIYRSIRNPAARKGLMWHLLELAPHNQSAPEMFDEILRAYDSIRVRRNEYVHGLWSTKQDDGTVYLARFPEHGGWTPGEAEPEPIEALNSLVMDIKELRGRIWREAQAYIGEVVLERQLEQARSIEAHREKRARRRAAAAPPPPPESSEGSGE